MEFYVSCITRSNDGNLIGFYFSEIYTLHSFKTFPLVYRKVPENIFVDICVLQQAVVLLFCGINVDKVVLPVDDGRFNDIKNKIKLAIRIMIKRLIIIINLNRCFLRNNNEQIRSSSLFSVAEVLSIFH
jgi:hypothetical protein